MKYAIIKNGKVENVIEAEQAFAESMGAIPAGYSAVGDLWNGSAFTAAPPAPPVIPQSVTMRQARLALMGAGKLATVNAAIAGMAGVQGDAARIEWEFSSEVKRGQPLVVSMGQVLGLNAEQLDALFTTASGL